MAQLLSERNLIVRGCKPVESGCRRKEDCPATEDAGTLQTLVRSNEALGRLYPSWMEPALKRFAAKEAIVESTVVYARKVS